MFPLYPKFSPSKFVDNLRVHMVLQPEIPLPDSYTMQDSFIFLTGLAPKPI